MLKHASGCALCLMLGVRTDPGLGQAGAPEQDTAGCAQWHALAACARAAPQDDAVVPQLPAWAVPSGMAITSQVWDFLPGSSLPGLPGSLPGLAKQPVTQRRDDGAELLLSETVVAPQLHLAAGLVPDTSPTGPQGSISRVPSLGDPAFAPLLDELLSWQ